MNEKRIFAKYGTLMIDMTHQQCWFLKGECTRTPDDKYDYPEITIDDKSIEYVYFGMPNSDNIVSFNDPYADQNLDINDRPRIEVWYDSFSVIIHNDPDNQRTYMDFRNVELLTPYDFETNRFITWEEYDAAQKCIRELMEKKSDFEKKEKPMSNKKRLFCKFENVIINLTTGVGQFVDPYDLQETYCVPTKTFSVSDIHDIKVRTDTDGKPTLIFVNNLIPITCEFTTFNSLFNLTGPPQDNVLYFYDVSVYEPIMNQSFTTWESYDRNKHRNDFQAIFTKYSDIVNNDTKYLQPHSKEYFEFDSHIYEDRFLVIDEKSRYDGEPLQVYEDLKIAFADDKTFIRIIINKAGNGLRHWFVYSMELSFNTDGTFIDADEYPSPTTVLETFRPLHEFTSWIHEYVHNIGGTIDSKYKKD